MTVKLVSFGQVHITKLLHITADARGHQLTLRGPRRSTDRHSCRWLPISRLASYSRALCVLLQNFGPIFSYSVYSHSDMTSLHELFPKLVQWVSQMTVGIAGRKVLSCSTVSIGFKHRSANARKVAYMTPHGYHFGFNNFDIYKVGRVAASYDPDSQ